MATLTLLLAINDYIINANKIFIELEDNIDSFKKETFIIDEIKCYLINYHNLEDFNYPGVYIDNKGYGYGIYYDDIYLEIEVSEGVITDYKLN